MSVPFNSDWSDLGDWNSVWEGSKKDEFGVATKGNALSFDCKNVLLRSEDDSQTLVGLGL